MTTRKTHAVETTTARWPHRRFRPVDRGRWRGLDALPVGFLGTLVMVAAVEAAVVRAGGRFLGPVGYGWGFSARAPKAKVAASEVLCLGDSLVKHGLVPGLIRDVTGRTAYNIAAPASPVPLTYMLLRRALDAGAKPAAIVFDMKPSLLIGGPRYAVAQFSRVLTLREGLELSLTERSGTFAAEMAVGSLLPSYTGRHEIRNNVMVALRGETDPLGEMNAACERNWAVNDGVNLATPRKGYDGGVTEPEHWHLISRGFHPHRVNADYARKLLALADERKIPAYLVLPPFVPKVNERRRETGAEEKYTAFVRSLQDRHPGLTVLDAREAGYPPSVFVDPIHLDVRGGLALSEGVAVVLRDDFARSAGDPAPPKRWVRLPAYRDRPIPAGLEDFEASRARIKQTTGR